MLLKHILGQANPAVSGQVKVISPRNILVIINRMQLVLGNSPLHAGFGMLDFKGKQYNF